MLDVQIAALERARTDMMKTDLKIRNNEYQIDALRRANAELAEVRRFYLDQYREVSFMLLLRMPHRAYCKLMRIP